MYLIPYFDVTVAQFCVSLCVSAWLNMYGNLKLKPCRQLELLNFNHPFKEDSHSASMMSSPEHGPNMCVHFCDRHGLKCRFWKLGLNFNSEEWLWLNKQEYMTPCSSLISSTPTPSLLTTLSILRPLTSSEWWSNLKYTGQWNLPKKNICWGWLQSNTQHPINICPPPHPGPAGDGGKLPIWCCSVVIQISYHVFTVNTVSTQCRWLWRHQKCLLKWQWSWCLL